MKKTILILIFLLIQTNSAWTEGIWSVNGYQLSNVNILHRSNTVSVNGRIQGGQGADYLKIRILVANDNGFRGWAETSVQHYAGKGELFDAQFKYYPKARLWNIEKIEVIGSSISGVLNNQDVTKTLCTVTSIHELNINLYDYDKGYKKSFSVGPGRPYTLDIKSGHYRAEIIAGKASKTQSVNFPAGVCTWNFQ